MSSFSKFFLDDERGVLAIKFALVLPVVLAAFGFTIDRVRHSHAQGSLQAIADTAALAGAKELSLADRKHEDLAAIVQAVAESFAKQDGAETRRRRRP